MKLIRRLKALKWLLDNKESLEKLINKGGNSKSYSLKGVPDYQKTYIKDLISGNK